MTATTGLSYGTAPNQVISADNGIDYAYREVGAVVIPLVLLQHFRGNLENWDFQLVDALASQRRVVAFDNVGVGGTTGTTPNTIAQMARDTRCASGASLIMLRCNASARSVIRCSSPTGTATR